jgi:drug/metabolite transporter (DMT)-like permease
MEMASSDSKALSSPLLWSSALHILWSTGGLFIKATQLSAFELSFGRSLLAAIVIAIFTRREGFGINPISALTSVLYAALLMLFVLSTKLTTAANAIFLQYTAPVYVLLLEPIFYKEKFRARDFATVAACLVGMSLFFVGKLRPQDRERQPARAGFRSCFALFFLLLRHSKARNVNRASSTIYGNLLVVIICAPAFFGAARRGISLADFGSVAYLALCRLDLRICCSRSRWRAVCVRSTPASSAMSSLVLNPIWVFFFLGERPSGWAIVGGMIIIASVSFICSGITGRSDAWV